MIAIDKYKADYLNLLDLKINIFIFNFIEKCHKNKGV
jgi:hypothetical protein